METLPKVYYTAIIIFGIWFLVYELILRNGQWTATEIVDRIFYSWGGYNENDKTGVIFGLNHVFMLAILAACIQMIGKWRSRMQNPEYAGTNIVFWSLNLGIWFCVLYAQLAAANSVSLNKDREIEHGLFDPSLSTMMEGWGGKVFGLEHIAVFGILMYALYRGFRSDSAAAVDAAAEEESS